MSKPVSTTPYPEHKVGIYTVRHQLPRYEKCKDGKMHTDGCLQDKIDGAYKALVDVSTRIRGLFASLPFSSK